MPVAQRTAKKPAQEAEPIFIDKLAQRSPFIDKLKRSYDWYKKTKNPRPENEAGLQDRDHRSMVGGMWDEIGTLQFEYMKQQGLKRDDVFCDVACGSFRAGRFFIPYLNPGNYLGIDKQAPLIEAGRKAEVPDDVWERQRPEIVISDSFKFNRFSKRPTMALAQSLFTHLRKRHIRQCLQNLFLQAAPGCKFYATFNEMTHPIFYWRSSHSSRRFDYPHAELMKIGEKAGWQPHYIGDWKHPRKQQMLLFVKPSPLAR